MAHVLPVDMATAFDALLVLLVLADEEGLSLGNAARRVTDGARSGTLGSPSTSS